MAPWVSPGSNVTPESAAKAREAVKGFLRPIAKTIVSPVVQLPRSFAAGVAGLAGQRELTARLSRPVNVPFVGQVKGLSAAPGDVERYGTQTGGETAAQAVELAATVLPVAGAGALTRLGGRVAGRVLPQAAKPLTRKIVGGTVQAGADFALGSAAGSSGAYLQGERDPGELLKAGLATGVISAGLPLAISGGVAGIKGLKRTVGGAVSDRLAAAETSLAQRVATKQEAKLAPVTVEARIQKIMAADPEKKTILQKLKGAAQEVKKMATDVDEAKLAGVRFLRDTKTYFVDSDAPVLAQAGKMRRMGLDDQAKQLEDAVVSTRAARTQGFGQALEDDNALRAVTGGDPKVSAGVDQVLEMKTRLDTATRDGNTELATRIQGDIDRVKSVFSPEDAAKIDRGAALSVQQNDQNLQRLVDNGLISGEAADTYRKVNPNYSKIYDLEHVLDKTHGPSVGTGKDVAETGIKLRKEAEITAGRASVDAREANAINKILTEERIARNSRTKAMVDADTQAGTGQFTKLAEEEPGSITLFRDGQKEFYKPEDPRLQRYFKGQEQDWGSAWKVVGKLGDYTRTLATQVNPVFGVKNFIRDQQSRLSNLDLPWTYGDMAKATGAAKDFVEGRANNIATRAFKLGGPMGSADFKRAGADTVTELARKLIQRKPEAGIFGRVRQLSEISELGTRINIMLAAERAGIKDPTVIRSMMREATLDFAAAGTFVRELNKGVPFFNAGLQGLRTTLRSLARDPAGFTRRQQILAIYPQILLDSHNKQFSTYDKVSPEEKRLNHIYVVGEGTDEEGKKFPKYIKIPKGEGNRLFSNITGILTNDNIPWEDKGKLIVNEFGSATPLQGEVFSTGNVSGVPIPIPIPGGAPVSAIIGTLFNKDWKGNYIVSPELLKRGTPLLERTKSTPKAVTDLSDALYKTTGIQLSPQRTAYLLRTVGSGLGSQVFSALTKGYEVAKTGEFQAKDTSIPAAMAETPLFNAFVGTSASALPIETTMANVRGLRGLGLVEWKEDRKRDEMIASLQKLPKGEARKQFIEEGLKNKSFTQADVENVLKESKKKQYAEGISPSDPQALKGIKLFNRLQNVDDPAERQRIVREIKKAGAINDKTAVAYNAYKAYQQVQGLPKEEMKAKLKEMEAEGQFTATKEFVDFIREYLQMDSTR